MFSIIDALHHLNFRMQLPPHLLPNTEQDKASTSRPIKATTFHVRNRDERDRVVIYAYFGVDTVENKMSRPRFWVRSISPWTLGTNLGYHIRCRSSVVLDDNTVSLHHFVQGR